MIFSNVFVGDSLPSSHFFTQSLSQSGFFKSASPAYLFLLHHPKLFQYSSEWSHTIPYGPIQFLIAPYSPLWSHTVLYSPMKSLTVTYSLIKSHFSLTLYPLSLNNNPLSLPLVPYPLVLFLSRNLGEGYCHSCDCDCCDCPQQK